MLRFEWKKIIRYRFFWLLFFCFLILDFFYIKSKIIPYSDQETDVYSTIAGKLDTEKTKAFLDKYQGMTEEDPLYIIYSDYYEKLKYVYNYGDEIREILQKAKDGSRQHSSQAVTNRNRKIEKLYGDRSIDSFYDMNDEEQFLQYDFSKGLCLLLLSLAVPYLIWKEKGTRMNELLWTCGDACVRVTRMKLLFFILFTAAVTAAFFCVDLAGFLFWGNLDGLFMPNYAILDYRYSSIGYTVFGVKAVEYAMWEAANLFFVLLFAVLAGKMKKMLSVFMGCTGVMAVSVFLCIYSDLIWNPLRLSKYAAAVMEFHVFSMGKYVFTESHVVFVLFCCLDVAGFLLFGRRRKRKLWD